MRLETKEIHEYQKNRYPYLLVDVAEEVVPGVSAKGYKNLSINDWFFDCHFPGDPNMPGMLQIEALVQMCALSILSLPGNKGKVVYLTSANNIKFIKVIDNKEIENFNIFKISKYKTEDIIFSGNYRALASAYVDFYNNEGIKAFH